jgi:hypothetical protein
MKSSGKWMTLGSAALAAGVALLAAWLVTRPSVQPFWNGIGIAAIAVTAFGVVALLVGFALPQKEEPNPERKAPQQVLRAGANSVVYQAGHDNTVIHMSEDETDAP